MSQQPLCLNQCHLVFMRQCMLMHKHMYTVPYVFVLSLKDTSTAEPVLLLWNFFKDKKGGEPIKDGSSFLPIVD